MINLTTNGHAAAPATDEIMLAIYASPSSGQVRVSVPQVGMNVILKMLGACFQALAQLQEQADKRITVPDMQVTKRIVS